MRNSIDTNPGRDFFDIIKDFLEWKEPNREKLEEDDFRPEEYDFKRNMYEYYKEYEGNVRKKLGDEAYEEFMNGMPYGTEEKSGIEEWLAYKTADAKWPGLRFDCDNSNTTCTLTRLIYVLLWNWGTEDKDNDKMSQPLKVFADKEFGGDTMNSFATTFNEYMREAAHNAMSAEKIAEMFSKTGVEFWRGEIGEDWERWDKFARNTHCIGNFVLVPYYFNRYRYGKTKDYWDLSLDLLRNNDGKLNNDGKFGKKNRDWETDKKSLDEADTENMPIAWSREDFSRYINLFFLWDYVECEALDENGSPKPRRLFDRKREGILLPQRQIDFQNFLDNANERIERRSRFMAAMLKIASGINYDKGYKNEEYKNEKPYEYCGDYQDEWKDWKASGSYKLFVDKVFLQDKVYDGYNGAIRRMKDVIDNTEGLRGTLEAKWLHAVLGELSVLGVRRLCDILGEVSAL